jgi:imidazolonepropionase-like amidohydrolase
MTDLLAGGEGSRLAASPSPTSNEGTAVTAIVTSSVVGAARRASGYSRRAVGIELRPALAVALTLTAGCVRCDDVPEVITGAVAPASITITNVRVFSATSSRAVEAQDVRIEAGRIHSVVPAGTAAPAALSIDGAGGTLIPGLVDFHVHLNSSPAPPGILAMPDPEHHLAAFLYAGVTTVVSMSDPPDLLADLIQRLDAGEIAGPRVLHSGLAITRTGGHPAAMFEESVPWALRLFAPAFATEIDQPSEIEAEVRARKAAGATLVKVVVDEFFSRGPRLDAEHVRQAVRAARAHGLKIAAHVGTPQDVAMAREAGVDFLNHIAHRGPIGEDEAAALAAAGVAVSPTLIVFDRVSQGVAGTLELTELDRALMPPAIQADLAKEKLRAHRPPEQIAGWIREVATHRQEQRDNVARLYRAGVKILVGTDSVLPANMAGASIHQEMRLLVAAGLPPHEVLLGATSRPAELLGASDWGTIEPGKTADLVLLDGDPLADIEATAKLRAVIQAGRVIQRRE